MSCTKHDEERAYFVLSKSVALKKYEELARLADHVSYSMKTNREVGKVLEDGTGCLFSVHTLAGVMAVEDKERLWFFAQGWSEGDIEGIFGMGVRKYVVDNENDLNTLLGFVSEKDEGIEIMLRMRLKENTIHTGKHFVFGMYSDVVNRLVRELKENKNVKKIGIHFHRKTQNISEWSLRYEFESVIPKDVLSMIDYVNIGGGLPSEYKNYRAEVIGRIFKSISEFREYLNSNKVSMIIEPGRYIAAPAVRLVATIKNIYNNNIIVNCSVYNADMDVFVSHLRLLIEGELGDNEGVPYTIKGCTPCSIDIFRYKVNLDEKKVGDKIVFLNAGAYNFSSDFCNLTRIETRVVD